MIVIVFWRTLFFYLFLLVVMRIMGKREIGGLAPIDLVVTIIMAELAAIPIQDPEVPILAGAVPIATIMLLQLVLSSLSLRNRRWPDNPQRPAQHPHQRREVVPSEMKKVRYTLDGRARTAPQERVRQHFGGRGRVPRDRRGSFRDPQVPIAPFAAERPQPPDTVRRSRTADHHRR